MIFSIELLENSFLFLKSDCNIFFDRSIQSSCIFWTRSCSFRISIARIPLTICSPYQSLEYILDDQVALGDDDQQSYVGPGKQGKLFHVIFFHKGKDEPNEPNDVEAERNESVIRHEYSQVILSENKTVEFC